MSDATDSPWQPDEYSQPEADYHGNSGVHRTRKRSGRRSKAAHAASMRRYRARHRLRLREYQRGYQAQRRARIRVGVGVSGSGP